MALPSVVRWRPLDGPGLEHLTLRQAGDRLTAESVVIGEREKIPFGLSYRLVLDPRWRLLEADIHLAGSEQHLSLRGDGDGNWRDGNGTALAALTGCIDIDIAVTPFTNTLPIRRLAMPIDGATEIDVVYLALPDLTPQIVRQHYTRTGIDRYVYENLSSTFKAELPVDSDGLVVDYPGLFERLAPG